MDALLRKTVALGVDPLLAVQMATLNPATYFGLRPYGAIAPGAVADLVVVNDLHDFTVEQVFKRGTLVAEQGHLVTPLVEEVAVDFLHTVHLPPLSRETLTMPATSSNVRVIGVVPGQILTRQHILQAAVRDGRIVADPSRDLLKLVVVERHRGTGNVGLGLVTGFGLRAGAIATSVAHDSHNLIAVGADDGDLLCALQEVGRLQGCFAICQGGRVFSSLALPIAGLMTSAPLSQVISDVEALHRNAQALGTSLARPLMALSFLALPVIPELRLTDRGLVDVNRSCFVSLSVE
jgi:adenine deaminase